MEEGGTGECGEREREREREGEENSGGAKEKKR